MIRIKESGKYSPISMEVSAQILPYGSPVERRIFLTAPLVCESQCWGRMVYILESVWCTDHTDRSSVAQCLMFTFSVVSCCHKQIDTNNNYYYQPLICHPILSPGSRFIIQDWCWWLEDKAWVGGVELECQLPDLGMTRHILLSCSQLHQPLSL